MAHSKPGNARIAHLRLLPSNLFHDFRDCNTVLTCCLVGNLVRKSLTLACVGFVSSFAMTSIALHPRDLALRRPSNRPYSSADPGRTSLAHSELITSNHSATIGAFVWLAFPAWSQVARPPYRVKAMPLRTCPSSPTELAGTANLTHWPAAGSAPMKRRLLVPLVPQSILFAPQ